MNSTVFRPANFDASPIATAIKGLYRVGAGLSEYVNDHIDAMTTSADAAVSAAGRVLAAAKKGFVFGYAAPVIAIAIGQMLLGNPLAAVAGAMSLAISPVAMTCAAIGAIWMGWKALSEDERASILERAAAGFNLTLRVVQSVIQFVDDTARQVFGSKTMTTITETVREQAAIFGRTLYSITGSISDRLKDVVPRKPPTPEGGHEALRVVLDGMSDAELFAVAKGPLRCTERLDSLSQNALRDKVDGLIGDAAAHSLPWAERPDYPDVVAMVAKQLNLPTPSGVHVRELERVILFKVLEASLEKLDDRQKAALTEGVQRELEQRGIHGRVVFDEIWRFVKFGGVDVGGTLGGLVMAAPGMYGIVGMNFLQFVILKGIILTSGYMAGGAAVLGFGAGGVLLSIAGAAGPIGAGLAVLYTAYALSGPAFRKLVPVVCMIAAKRLELAQSQATDA